MSVRSLSRLNTRVVGYNSPGAKLSKREEEELLRYVDARDLKSFGLIPEIIGRLPIITYLHPLHRDTLRMILTEPKNALVRQYTKIFELDGIHLTFTDEPLTWSYQRPWSRSSVPVGFVPSWSR